MAKKRAARALTPKDLGLVPETKLSQTYVNSRTQFKVVEDYILGFWIVGDGHLAPVRIAPIYRAQVYLRPKTGGHGLVSSCEVGELYNPDTAPNDPDFDGNALASIASNAIGALQRHAERRAAEKKKRK